MAYTNIDDPSAHFQIATWAGNDTQDTAITFDGNSNLQPDLFWNKGRGVAFGHVWMDTSRGIGNTGKVLESNSTGAEYDINDYFETADTNGFTIGRGSAGFNALNDTYITWCWKANGGTTSSNTDGATTSTVQANTDAGFSIVTWTGTGSATTLGHGLGDTPKMLIVKNRDTAVDWAVYHKELTNPGYVLAINNTDAQVNSGFQRWNRTHPTSSVFSVGTGQQTNQNTNNMVAYCFAEKQGYSKFGKYKGNENANGPFIYTGFKPALIIIKNASVVTHWAIIDTKRIGYNDDNYRLYPNLNNIENTSDINLDILSNGFKIRTLDSDFNNGASIIYAAFAENPFVTSTGIPATAR